MFLKYNQLNKLFCDCSETWQMDFQDPASPIMEGIINLHHDLIFFLIVIFGLVSWILFSILINFTITKNNNINDDIIDELDDEFNELNGKEYQLSPLLKHNTLLEFIWTIIPSLIIILIAIPSFALIYGIDDVVDPQITIKVIGHQWYWSYEYSNIISNTKENLDSYCRSLILNLRDQVKLDIAKTESIKINIIKDLKNEFNNLFFERVENINYNHANIVENHYLYILKPSFDLLQDDFLSNIELIQINQIIKPNLLSIGDDIKKALVLSEEQFKLIKSNNDFFIETLEEYIINQYLVAFNDLINQWDKVNTFKLNCIDSYHASYYKDEYTNLWNSLRKNVTEYKNFKKLEKISFDSYIVPENELQIGHLRLLEVDNQVILPIHKHIRILVTSTDVLHSWAVPSLGVKIDACPGRLNQVALYINRPGIYYGQCSEICGINHGFIPIVVKAIA